MAVDMPKAFFLVLFACCRDSYVDKELEGEQATAENSKAFAARGGSDLSQVKVANFTLMFGSNPATGAKSDKKFISAFLRHLDEMFDPEDGTLLLPECLGNIDTL